jgi:hypothetical protein
MPARDPADPPPLDPSLALVREDGLRRTGAVTTSLVAVSAAAVVGFGVLAHDHRAGSAATAATVGTADDGSGTGTGGQTSPSGGGLVSGGSGRGRFDGRTSGS